MAKFAGKFASFAKLIPMVLCAILLTYCHNKLTIQSSNSFNFNENAWKTANGISQVTSSVITPTFIFAGTPDGLYKINRSDNSTSKVAKLAEFNVRYIINRGKLLQLNDGMYYDFQNDVVSGVYKPDNIKEIMQSGEVFVALTDNNNIYLIKGNDTLIVDDYQGTSLGNVQTNNDTIWIPGDLRVGITRYISSSSLVDIVPVGYDFRNYTVSDHGDLLEFHNNEGVLEFNKKNKKAFFTNTEERTDIALLNSEELPFFRYVSAELTKHTGDFKSSFEKFKEIESNYGKSNNKRVRQKMAELKASLADLLPYNFLQSKDLEKYITDTINDNVITGNYYLHLIEMANYEGKFAESLHYDSILTLKYADASNSEHKKAMHEVKLVHEKIANIQKSNRAPDEKQWETAKAVYNLFFIVGPQKNGVVNMNYPFSLLKKLKKEYPESQFSDNVDYLILKHIEDGLARKNDETLYLKVLNEYLALIRKYPSSELIPFFLERSAWLNYNYPFNVDVKLLHLESARSTLKEILEKHPDHYSQYNLQELGNKVNQAIAMSQWEFRTELRKKILHPGDPVNIVFSLKNTGDSAKSLPLSADNNLPNFVVSIDRYGLYGELLEEHLILQPDFSSYDKSKSDTLIQSGQKYEEQWNLLTRARNNFDGPAGSYNLSKEGRYMVTARPINEAHNDFIKPAAVWITVTN